MNVLVTGCAGFIGSVLCERLLAKGYNVIGIDDLRFSKYENIPNGVISYIRAIEDYPNYIFAEHQIDVVCHLAADSVMGISTADPKVFFNNNVANGIKLLNTMNYYGVKNIVFASTASSYGEPLYTPIDEDHPLNPINAYGESKVMFEHILEWYRKAYDFRYCTFRFFNVSGATEMHGENRKFETRLVPLVIDAIVNDSPLYVYGNDWNTPDHTCLRDYVHVKDIADAHILGIERLKVSDRNTYNLGGEKAYSVLEIIGTLEGIIGKRIADLQFTDRRPGDPERLLASSELAKSELGWKPTSSNLRTILKDAYDYFRVHCLEVQSRP